MTPVVNCRHDANKTENRFDLYRSRLAFPVLILAFMFEIVWTTRVNAQECSKPMPTVTEYTYPPDGKLSPCNPSGSGSYSVNFPGMCGGGSQITAWQITAAGAGTNGGASFSYTWDPTNIVWVLVGCSGHTNYYGVQCDRYSPNFQVTICNFDFAQTITVTGVGSDSTAEHICSETNTSVNTVPVYKQWILHFDDSGSDAGDSSTPSYASNPAGGGGSCSSCQAQKGPLGAGAVDNNQGPKLSLPLGSFSSTDSAGSLSVFAYNSSISAYSPASLYVPYIPASAGVSVDIVTNSSGVIQQARVPDGLVNVVPGTYGYSMQMFYSSNVTAKSPGTGLYGTNAAAFAVWTVANPDNGSATNRVTVTESRPGISDRQFTFIYTNDSGIMKWCMTDNVTARTVWSWQAVNPTNSNLKNVCREIRSGGATVQKTQKTYLSSGGYDLLAAQTEGAGSNTRTTTYTYNSSNLVQTMQRDDGYWEYCDYDDNNRLTDKYCTYLNSSAPTPGASPDPNSCKWVTYYYGLQEGDSGYQPNVARTESVYLPVDGTSTLVSQIVRFAPTKSEMDEWVVFGSVTDNPTQTAIYTDLSNTNALGNTQWQLRPDGTATFYYYQQDANGVLTNICVTTGSPDSVSSPTQVINGTQQDTTINSVGKTTMIMTRDLTNGMPGAILSKQVYTYLDSLYQSYFVADLANRTNQFQYDCCGLASSVDPEGVTTVYGYDNLKRQISAATYRGTNIITVTNNFDAAGRVLSTTRIGGDGSTQLLSQTAYDVLGRAILQTNAYGGVTTNVYVINNNQQSITTYYPDGGTRAETYYRDGQVQSVSGTAVSPVQYQYGADYDSTSEAYLQYTLKIKLASDGSTNEWVKTYTDGAGHAVKTLYAGANNPTATSAYNTSNQLIQQADPDGVATLYQYNAKGAVEFTSIDINRNGVWNDTSNRVAHTVSDIITNISGWGSYGINRVRTWETNDQSTETLVSEQWASADGLHSLQSSFGRTNQTITVYSGSQRTITSIGPDNSSTVSVYLYGQLQSTTRHDGNSNQISGTTFAYDPHGRPKSMTDARNGTTSYTYNGADQVNSTTTPAPGNGASAQVTTNFFDNVGRIIYTKLPDATWTTNLYTKLGQIQQTSGSRTYPVAYTYDAQGRMKTMTTWKGFASGNGAAVTTWNYDPYRGFLLSKTYDSGTAGPSYAYTDAGRLLSRTWARGTNTIYAYNNAGDLFTVTYSDSGTLGVTKTYDRRGRLAYVYEGASIYTAFAYNDAGAVLTEAHSGGWLDGVKYTNTYDALLRRTNNSTIGAKSIYTYDAASRLQSVSDGTDIAQYSYLANSSLVGNITNQQSGVVRMITTKQYDSLNRLTNIVSSTNSAAVAQWIYQYNQANQRTQASQQGAAFGNAAYWSYQYDALGQVTSARKYWSDGTSVAGQQFAFGFDDIGNRTQTQTGGNQYGGMLRTASYAANSLNQYTGRTVPSAVDIIGSANATATVTINNQAPYRRNDYYRLQLGQNNSSGAVWSSVTNYGVLNNGTNADIVTTNIGNVFLPKTPETFSYDSDGNLTSDGRWTYVWDAENRLIQMIANSVTSGSQSLKFAYDFQGRRVSKRVWSNRGSTGTPDVTLKFLYDGWNPVSALNASGAIIATYTWGLDLSGSQQGAGGVGGLVIVGVSGSGTNFVAYDGNGNVSFLVNSLNGAITAQYEYGPFGEVIRQTGTMAKANPFRFSTKYQDDETDLLYYGYRYYNPSTGRWLSRDPIEEQGGVNLYTLNVNSCISFVDYVGLTYKVHKIQGDNIDARLEDHAWYTPFPMWSYSFWLDANALETSVDAYVSAGGHSFLSSSVRDAKGEVSFHCNEQGNIVASTQYVVDKVNDLVSAAVVMTVNNGTGDSKKATVFYNLAAAFKGTLQIGVNASKDGVGGQIQIIPPTAGIEKGGSAIYECNCEK